ncbi:hypothetical protein [Rhizobium beringeri]|uniref:hypothetical protein n=1 Tax=Rhizobium beringeri TaxID=3019934 RepID=UPI002E0D90D5|nr:hypothetical protein U8P75_16415 [Rhizobium beringeri]WSH78879.1 hypothetical protein U8P69_16295 [Rhizobium beringeri]
MSEYQSRITEPNQVPDFRKDYKLDRLAEHFNVAQFVSFAPSAAEPRQQYARLANLPENSRFESLKAALEALFERSADGTVNVRSFSETETQSREFLYALKTVDEAAAAIRRIAAEGAHTIANETIDVSDGGVSGVAMGGLVEFRPDATPRGVERPGFASLPTAWATQLFKIVYGFDPGLEASDIARIEFSLHPRARGWRQTNTIFWEYSDIDHFDRSADVRWPNDFSRLIGDKAYGLLIGHVVGLPVPRTTVISRRVAPFTFGRVTGSAEQWIRTAPFVQVPGKYTTARGWQDPFRLMQSEDPEGVAIASVIAQQGIPADYSGAAIEASDGELIVEGARGTGEGFMQGSVGPQSLPAKVLDAVGVTHAELRRLLGSVRFEWVSDGVSIWVVQLHIGASQSLGSALVPGEATHWVDFDVADGLEALRQLVASLDQDTGIYMNGSVGRTSHIADVVRKAGVPTRLRGMGDHQKT